MNYYPLGIHWSTPLGKFKYFPLGVTFKAMQTVHDTRRQRLEMLIEQHGSIAKLNEALKWPRTDSRLSRIKNANARSDRDGKVFQMGDNIAREIEDTLDLGTGFMDTPPSYADLHGQVDPIAKALDIMSSMEPETRFQALRLLDAIAQPPKANGTTGHD